MKLSTLVLIATCLLLATCCHAATPDAISLAGEWWFDLDPNNSGLSQAWYEPDHLSDTARLPGSNDTNGKGVPNTRQPDMQHLSRLYEYTGPAWYQREITIPEDWKGKRVSLFLERCHWETQVWMDSKPLGTQDSLCVPHVYDLGIIKPRKHLLTIRVDNTMKHNVGGWAHSVTEETQTNWNGIVGRIELRAEAHASIAGLQVYPNVQAKKVKVSAVVSSGSYQPLELILRVRERGSSRIACQGITKLGSFTGGKTVESTLRIPNARLWDEFSPNLYELEAVLISGGKELDIARATFGMRELAVRNKRIELNGRRIFLRGTLECCIFPRTGYPPTDIDSWLRIFRICKSYGLNHMRFHSWCPPEAAFAAADRLGFLLQVEAPQWVGDVGQESTRDIFIEAEVREILDTYGNHPSFGMLCMGNELKGDPDFLQKLVLMGKRHDPRHLYTSSTAWSFGPNDDYNVAVVRGLHGPTTDADFSAEGAKHQAPIISHEIGQWAVLPNIAEIPKYNGVLRARNLELLRDNLRAHSLLDQAPAFVEASGKLSVLLYKEEIEVLLRTRGHGGFQLLDLHDFPGQGTSTVGLLDAFWDSKGLTTPEQYRRFCGPTVPLLRMPKRTYTSDEVFTARAEIAHYGPVDIAAAKPVWSIKDKRGQVIASGNFDARRLATGDLHALGSISVPLSHVDAPAELIVTVSLAGTKISNDWRIWVYPAQSDTATPDTVLKTTSPDEAVSALEQGRRVLLLASSKTLVSSRSGGFLPVFWSPAMFKNQAARGMGILCDPTHPSLGQFPTDSHSNWQWYELLDSSRTMVLDGTPAGFRPIVQVIDNFVKNQKLGMLVEARVGEGRLLLCSMDLTNDLDKRPAARQMLVSLLTYAASQSFQPAQHLTIEELRTIIGEPKQTLLQSLGATVTTDSEDAPNGNIAANIIDGDPDTIWHTQWGENEPLYPHQVTISLPNPVEISGFRCLPRQDISNGWFTHYEFFVSDDGKIWGGPVAKGTIAADADEKIVRLSQPVHGRYLRLVALKGHAGNPWAAIAEFDLIKP